MQGGIMYWLDLIVGGAVVGAAVGIIPLGLGFVLKVRRAGLLSFLACVLVGIVGGLKTLGMLFVPILMPIYQAQKDRKKALAQQGTQHGRAEDGEPVS